MTAAKGHTGGTNIHRSSKYKSTWSKAYKDNVERMKQRGQSIFVRRSKVAPAISRENELLLIELALQAGALSKCPTRFAMPSQASIGRKRDGR